MVGTVKTVKLDRGFGFISRPNERAIFFHCKSLSGLPFDDQLVERLVAFDLIDTSKGPCREHSASGLKTETISF